MHFELFVIKQLCLYYLFKTESQIIEAQKDILQNEILPFLGSLY